MKEFESLDEAGWITIDGFGEENVYFTFTDENGKTCNGFCKCL